MQLPAVTPEEVYLATLMFFCIKPPEHDGFHTPVDMKAFTREMAIFLLKELKVGASLIVSPSVIGACTRLLFMLFSTLKLAPNTAALGALRLLHPSLYPCASLMWIIEYLAFVNSTATGCPHVFKLCPAVYEAARCGAQWCRCSSPS